MLVKQKDHMQTTFDDKIERETVTTTYIEELILLTAYRLYSLLKGLE
jgi:hypothetical protein